MPANEAVWAMWKPVIIGKINMHVGLYILSSNTFHDCFTSHACQWYWSVITAGSRGHGGNAIEISMSMGPCPRTSDEIFCSEKNTDFRTKYWPTSRVVIMQKDVQVVGLRWTSLSSRPPYLHYRFAFHADQLPPTLALNPPVIVICNHRRRLCENMDNDRFSSIIRYRNNRQSTTMQTSRTAKKRDCTSVF